MITEKLREDGVQLLWSLGEGSFVNKGFFPGINKFIAPINVAEKGSANLMIIAKAKGGHSSTPPKKTAVTILAEALVKLENKPLPGSLKVLVLLCLMKSANICHLDIVFYLLIDGYLEGLSIHNFLQHP